MDQGMGILGPLCMDVVTANHTHPSPPSSHPTHPPTPHRQTRRQAHEPRHKQASMKRQQSRGTGDLYLRLESPTKARPRQPSDAHYHSRSASSQSPAHAPYTPSTPASSAPSSPSRSLSDPSDPTTPTYDRRLFGAPRPDSPEPGRSHASPASPTPSSASSAFLEPTPSVAVGALKGLSESVAAVDGELQATTAQQGKLDEQRRQQEKARGAQMATNAERAAAIGQWRKRSTLLWEDARAVAARGEEVRARLEVLGRMDAANAMLAARQEEERPALAKDSRAVCGVLPEAADKATGVAQVVKELRKEISGMDGKVKRVFEASKGVSDGWGGAGVSGWVCRSLCAPHSFIHGVSRICSLTHRTPHTPTNKQLVNAMMEDRTKVGPVRAGREKWGAELAVEEEEMAAQQEEMDTQVPVTNDMEAAWQVETAEVEKAKQVRRRSMGVLAFPRTSLTSPSNFTYLYQPNAHHPHADRRRDRGAGGARGRHAGAAGGGVRGDAGSGRGEDAHGGGGAGGGGGRMR